MNIKIKQLSEVNTVNDSDIFIVEDANITHKITSQDLIHAIKNHPEILDAFLHTESRGAANGTAPLNSNQKLDPQYLTFGRSAGMIYEGSTGAALEQKLASHAESQENPHRITKAQLGLANVENKSPAQILSDLQSYQVINALGFSPEKSGSYSNAVAYIDQKISEIIDGASTNLNTLHEIGLALSDNADAVNGIIASLSNKADDVNLLAHTEDASIHTSSAEHDRYEAAYAHAISTHVPADANKTSSSETNGNIKINDLETTVYRHPQSNVGSGSYSYVTVDEQGHITQGANPIVSITQGGTGATSKEEALSKLGLTTTAETLNKLKYLTVTAEQLNHLSGVTENINERLNDNAAQIAKEQIKSHTLSLPTEPMDLKSGDFWEMPYEVVRI